MMGKTRWWLIAGIVFAILLFRDPVGTAHTLSGAWHSAGLFIDNL